jgi:effector-binding domain-containing protein
VASEQGSSHQYATEFIVIEPLRIIRTTPQLTALIPIRVSRDDVRKVMGPGLAELKAAVAAQNVTVVGPWFTHHVRNPGEVFDFEICLPVAAPIAPANRMKPGQWPAMNIVQTTYHGGYEGLGGAWSEFIGMIKVAGHKTAEGLYESYAVGPEVSADPNAWRTVFSKELVEV